MLNEKLKEIIKKILLIIGRLELNLPKIRGIHNRILKPITTLFLCTPLLKVDIS